MLKVVGEYLNENQLEWRRVGYPFNSSTSKHLSTTFSLDLLVVHGFSVCRGHCSPEVLTHVHNKFSEVDSSIFSDEYLRLP
jgi:hypothetical protein